MLFPSSKSYNIFAPYLTEFIQFGLSLSLFVSFRGRGRPFLSDLEFPDHILHIRDIGPGVISQFGDLLG